MIANKAKVNRQKKLIENYVIYMRCGETACVLCTKWNERDGVSPVTLFARCVWFFLFVVYAQSLLNYSKTTSSNPNNKFDPFI